MKLTNDCADCLNSFEDTVVIAGRLTREMKCEYDRGTFPHAVNCPTYIGETVECRGVGIGQEIEVGED